MCDGCFVLLPEKPAKLCPQCGVAFGHPPFRNRSLERVVEKMPRACPHGCGLVDVPGALQARHRNECVIGATANAFSFVSQLLFLFMDISQTKLASGTCLRFSAIQLKKVKNREQKGGRNPSFRISSKHRRATKRVYLVDERTALIKIISILTLHRIA